MANLRQLTEGLYEEGTPEYTSVSSYEPFTLSPRDYLEFADEDIKSINSMHSKINAMGNVKRAIDCRVDTLLHFWALRKKRDTSLDFSKKAEMLNEMGIITPRLIGKINRYRNDVEHGYEVPNEDKIYDYRDTAELFLGHTDPYLRLDPTDGNICNLNCYCDGDECRFGNECDSLDFMLNREKRQIDLVFYPGSRLDGKTEHVIRYSDDDYFYLINLWYRSVNRI